MEYGKAIVAIRLATQEEIKHFTDLKGANALD